MAEGVNYDVNAILRTSGSFGREMASSATAADMFGSSFGRMSDRLVTAGERVRGTFGTLAKDLAVGGALALGGGLVTGIAMAQAKGIEFNNMMEQGALGLATMYQTFGVNPAFEKNIQLAQAMQHELVAIADASPGTTADIMEAYQALAPGVTGVTQDLMRQRDLMEKIAVLGFATGNDYKQLGMDVGRIVTGVAGADVATFRTLTPVIQKAFKELTGKDVAGDFAQQFNKVAKADGELALRIFEKAVSSIGDEANQAFGESFGGVLASVESKMLKLAGDFGRPLFDSMREVMVYDLMGDGPLSDKAFGKLREAAFFAGGAIADLFNESASRMIEMVDYVANNWQSIAATIRDAGVAAGMAIKTAVVIGMTRHFVGSSMIVIGKMSTVIDKIKPAGEVFAARLRATHMSIGRGMKGGGAGVGGAIGRGMGRVLGREKGAGFNRFGLDKPLMQIAALTTTIGGLGLKAVLVVGAIGAIGVAIGGVTSWFVSKWDEISSALVVGLESGTISLVPLITSLYTFYLRLTLVGEAIMGTTSAADVASGGINLLTTAVDIASAALSPFIYALGAMVWGWATLKLAFQGVMFVMLQFIDLANSLGAVSDEVFFRAQKNYASFGKGVDETYGKAEKLFDAAKAIGDAQLSPLDYEKAKAKAKELEKSLADALKGTGTEAGGAKGGRGKKAAVKIDKVVVEVKLDDPDPDRVFAQVLPKWVDLADKRTQAYETMDSGS